METILVWLVEDDLSFRSILQTSLNRTKQLDCPKAFTTCEEALEALSTEIQPDIILLDIKLPGMSGIEGIPQIKRVSPLTHVIILTVWDDDDNIFRALCAGAHGYLLKNSPKEKIKNAIMEVIQGGSSINALVARKALDVFTKFVPQKAEHRLSEREKQNLRLIAEGLTKKEIADRLCLSHHTVGTHLRNIYEKLEVHSKAEAVAKALRDGII